MLENEEFHLHTVIFKEERNISKVGEIFHVDSDIFKLQCNQCDSEFFDFFSFVAHVGIHLANANYDEHEDNPLNFTKTIKSENDLDNAIENDECEIEEEQSIFENEIKAEPINVLSSSSMPVEYEHELIPELPKQKGYLCHHCPRVYRRKFSLKRHLERHMGGAGKFKCEKCNSRFHRKDLLQRHNRISCQKRKEAKREKEIRELISPSLITNTIQSKAECLRISCASSNGGYKCSICLQIYQRKFSLKRHIDQHFEAEFECKCSAKFRRRDLLHRHINQSCKDLFERTI